MFLKSIRLKNVRAFRDLALSFESADGSVRKWTVLLGENGIGKSTLLKSVALLTSGSDALGDLFPHPKLQAARADHPQEHAGRVYRGEGRHLGPNSLSTAEVEHFRQLHEAERPFLVNPYLDDPTHDFSWRTDHVLKEVELISDPSNPVAEPFCDAAIEIYGLNRLELKQIRYFHFSLYDTFRLVAEDPQLSPDLRTEVLDRIESMKVAAAPFAGMIRFFDLAPPPIG